MAIHAVTVRHVEAVRDAVSLDGRLIDTASIRQAKALLNKATALGIV